MYALLGDIKFEGYKGFSEFGATNETVISEHPVIEGKPRLQMTGEKLEEITIKFLLHSQYANPEREIEILQEYRRTGRVLPFVAGDGYNYGDYIIRAIGRSVTQTNDAGAIIGVEVEVTLVEVYVPGQKKKPANEKLAVGQPAISGAPQMPRPTEPQRMAGELKTINTQSGAMDGELKEAQRVPSKRERALRKAKDRIEKIRRSLEVIEDIGSNARDIISIFDSMQGQVAAVRSHTEALAIFIAKGDIHSAVNASGILRNGIGTLSVDAAPVNNLVGTRRDKESATVNGGTKFNFKFDGKF